MSRLCDQPASRILVVMPSWLGDTVMATPTLRSLRGLYPQAQISVLIRRNLRPLLECCPWIDRILSIPTRERGQPGVRRSSLFSLGRRLAGGNFDTAILLPNSFRSALLVRLAGIPRRVGYDRDGRGSLLTDCLVPRRVRGHYVPVPARDYYLGIARYLGAVDPDPKMEIFTRPGDDQRARELLTQAGYDPAGGRRLVILNPGANYGDAKMWAPERFAQVGEGCRRQLAAAVAVSGAPKERAILDKVIAAAQGPVIDLPALGVDLTLLKSVLRYSSLMVTNDTGPRHMAAALGVPVVTIFGPTDPAWSEIEFSGERQVRVPVWCGPCQKKICPLDHRCMTLVESEMVLQRAAELLGAGGPSAPASALISTP